VNEKKRHHYVPEAYLRAFCDSSGKLKVYPKEEGSSPYTLKPGGTGHRRYYYSQPTPEGGVDNNRLEDLFSTLEGQWPLLVKRMARREDVNDGLETLFEFAALQRVRVPASRDVTEARLAKLAKQLMSEMHAAGELPPLPPGLDGLWDKIDVAIDPHQSIHGMVHDLQSSVIEVFGRIGLFAVHNSTSLPFLTSDNPVIWFDPSVPDEEQRPYEVSIDGPILFIFPISPTMLLMGSDADKPEFSIQGLRYAEAPDESWVIRINETVCRYGYEVVYASSSRQEDTIKRYISISPVHDPEDAMRMIFGKRTKLPKW